MKWILLTSTLALASTPAHSQFFLGQPCSCGPGGIGIDYYQPYTYSYPNYSYGYPGYGYSGYGYQDYVYPSYGYYQRSVAPVVRAPVVRSTVVSSHRTVCVPATIRGTSVRVCR